MINASNNVIGRWKVMDCNYSVVLRKVVVKAVCVSCACERDFEVNKLNDLIDMPCYTCDNINNESKFENTLNIYKESSSNSSNKLIKSERDRYIIEKLERQWKEIIKNKAIGVCEDWLNVENFKEWAINNGYKPWKVLDRYDKNVGYFPDNCYWRIDKRYTRSLNAMNEDNTVSNTVYYIKDISYSIEDLKMHLSILKEECNELLFSKHVINKSNIANCILKLTECEEHLRKCSELIDKIDLHMK